MDQHGQDPLKMGRRENPRVRIFRQETTTSKGLPHGILCLAPSDAKKDVREITENMPIEPSHDNEYGVKHARGLPFASPQIHPHMHQYAQIHHQMYGGNSSGRIHQPHSGASNIYSEIPRGVGQDAGAGSKRSINATGTATTRTQAETSEIRKKIYRAELLREQLETQHRSLENHLSIATRDLGAHQNHLEGATKLLQELCRAESAALITERKRNCALADLLLAMRGRRQHCLLLAQTNARVRNGKCLI